MNTEEEKQEEIKALEIKTLSGWDLKHILEEARKYVEQNQFGFYLDVQENVKYSLGYLIKTVEVAHENHRKAMEDHYDKLDATYNSYAEKRTELANKLKNLPEIKFPNVPYVNVEGLQRLFDMAQKLSELPNDQWTKLLDLAKALGGK